MINIFRGFLIALFLVIPSQAWTASTSNWIRVDPKPAQSENTEPVLGGSYVTAEIISARIYQKSNWWTSLIESNRVGMIDVSATGKIGPSAIEDTRTSGPVELTKSNIVADLGFRQIIFSDLPTTYTNLQLSVRVSKSAKDGLEEAIKTVEDLSKATPAIAISAEASTAISATKSVVDFLFKAKLVQQKLASKLQFPASGKSLPAGYYVVFAGDSVSDYQQYLTPPAGSGGLKWDENAATLMYKNAPIGAVSYFIVEIRYKSRKYAAAVDSLSASNPWSKLYSVAREKAVQVSSLNDKDRVLGEIRSHIADAHTLLNADPQFIQSERDWLHTELTTAATLAFNSRLQQLADASSSGNVVAAVRPYTDFNTTFGYFSKGVAF